LAAWLYGRQIQMGQGNKMVAWVGILSAVVGGMGFILKGQLNLDAQLNWRSPTPANVAAAAKEKAKAVISWEPWSPSAVDRARAEGKPLLVDFTAKWCFTCQVNKRVYKDAALQKLITDKKIVLLKADWTNEDPRITKALSDLGKAAVPVNVLYLPGKPEPVVLPELLSVDNVSEALRQVGE